MREITVIIPTYNRPEILRQTIRNLLTHLKFNGKITVLVGDDSDDEHKWPFTTKEMAASYNNVIHLPGPRKGLGANLNMLLLFAETDVVMQMDDDHWLTDYLYVDQYYDDLIHPDSMNGWIRLFLGERKDYYENQRYYYKFTANNVGPYWYLMPRTTELYIPSNRPHIKHRRFHEMYGRYKEDVKLGDTEEIFCHQYENKFMELGPDKLWVTIPFFGLTMNQWQHVGNSWQKEGF